MANKSTLVSELSSDTTDQGCGHNATLFEADDAGRHDSVDLVGTLAPSVQDPSNTHQRKGMAALPPTPYDEPSRISLSTPAADGANDGELMESEEHQNIELITQPLLPELNISMLDWEEQCKKTSAVHIPHQAPCTFPTPPRDPFNSPPPIARLVQEVYIGHSPSPLLVPMQFSELPFEHGRVYPFGQRQPQHEFEEAYVFGTTGEEEGFLPDHPQEASTRSFPAVEVEDSQEMQGTNFAGDDLSGSIEAAENLLSLQAARPIDPVAFSSVPRTFRSLQGTQRPANRQCDEPPPATSIPLRSSRLTTTKTKLTQTRRGSFSNTEAVIMPKLTTNELARMMDLPTPAEYAEARRESGANVLKLPGLVSSSYFDLCHLMPAEEEAPQPQPSPRQDHVDEAVPRFVPTVHPSFFDAEPEDVSDTQELMGLVCRLINFGKLASILLNARGSKDVPIARIHELQQEAAVLALATQLFQERLDAQDYTLGTIEGNAELDAMLKELIASEETTRRIASLNSTQRHDFMDLLGKLKGQTTALAHRVIDLERIWEARHPSQLEQNVGSSSEAAQQTSSTAPAKPDPNYVAAGVDTMPVDTLDGVASDERVRSRVDRTEQPGTVCERIIALRETISSMHRMMDAVLGISR